MHVCVHLPRPVHHGSSWACALGAYAGMLSCICPVTEPNGACPPLPAPPARGTTAAGLGGARLACARPAAPPPRPTAWLPPPAAPHAAGTDLDFYCSACQASNPFWCQTCRGGYVVATNNGKVSCAAAAPWPGPARPQKTVIASQACCARVGGRRLP